MTRQQIREKFRAENPEITDRVITDLVLNTWMIDADKEIAAFTRCIVTNNSETFDAEVDVRFYDLSLLIDNFFDIDDIPGGGVYFNDVPLSKSSPAEMNQKRRNWRIAESGTPKHWWRRGKYLVFDKAPDDDLEIAVDCVLISDDFDSDAILPFNQLEHLIPYHDSISKYLQWRTKIKVGKSDEASIAEKAYTGYLTWMKKMVGSYSHNAIQLRPSSGQTG